MRDKDDNLIYEAYAPDPGIVGTLMFDLYAALPGDVDYFASHFRKYSRPLDRYSMDAYVDDDLSPWLSVDDKFIHPKFVWDLHFNLDDINLINELESSNGGFRKWPLVKNASVIESGAWAQAGSGEKPTLMIWVEGAGTLPRHSRLIAKHDILNRYIQWPPNYKINVSKAKIKDI